MDFYLDDTRLDILRNSFAVNWKWYDVVSPLKRYTVASTNMNIPFSPTNNSEFAHTNVAGSDLTPIWTERKAQIYFGNYLALTGQLKTNKIKVTGKEFQTNILGDNLLIDKLNANDPRAVMTSHATANLPATWTTLQNAVDNLFDGLAYGWLLPLIDDGSNVILSTTTTTNNYYLLANGLRQHELWLNVADFLTEAASLASITIKVYDGGLLRAFSSSNIYSIMRNEYIPAYHIGLKRSGVTTNVAWDATTGRTFDTANPQTIANSDLIIAGGNTTWDLIKIIAQYYNLGIQIDQQLDVLTFFDLNTLGASVDDWTDQVQSIEKIPVIKGYGKTSYINYRPTDNIDNSFAQIQLSNNANIDYIDEEKTIGTIDVGIPGIYDKYDANGVLKITNLFLLNYLDNKDVYKYPVILDLDNLQTYTSQVIIQDATGTLLSTKTLYKMAFLDTTSYFGWLEDPMLDINEFYICRIKLNLANFVDLNAYDMITIKNLGSKMYVNQIKGFNGQKSVTVELVKLE